MCVRFLPCTGYFLQQGCTTDGERCAWLISTNAWSTGASKLGRKRGTSYVARRLELAAVALPLWVSVAILLRALKGTGVFHLCLPTHTVYGMGQPVLQPSPLSTVTSCPSVCLRFVVHRARECRRSRLTAVYGQAHTRSV